MLLSMKVSQNYSMQKYEMFHESVMKVWKVTESMKVLQKYGKK